LALILVLGQTLNPGPPPSLAAKGAAAKLYETIDRVPTIDSADQGGLRPATCEGNLSLDGVSFSYPSRPGIQVLSKVSVVRLLYASRLGASLRSG
jgi:ABC-type multidrug transport system fused ATPase/permease subunit